MTTTTGVRFSHAFPHTADAPGRISETIDNVWDVIERSNALADERVPLHRRMSRSEFYGALADAIERVLSRKPKLSKLAVGLLREAVTTFRSI